jgi:flagellar biosynthesis anti-sigma factor FlgM
MRITEQFSRLNVEPVKTTGPTAATAGIESSQPSSQAAIQVNLSAAARELAKANGPGAVDEAKVARLRSAIDAGTLKVDTAKIAERLVEGD